MPYAAYLEFDSATNSKLDDLSDQIESLVPRIQTPRRLGHRHHLTMGVYENLDKERMIESLKRFQSSTMIQRIQLSSIGCFLGEQSVLFASPVANVDLLSLHCRYHEFASAEGHGEPNCRPGAWVPHATLAVGVKGSELGSIVTRLTTLWSPLNCKLERIRFVRFSPVETIWCGQLLQD